MKQDVDPNEAFVLRLMSFNILAQSLLELHPYLYKYHDIAALPWKVRKPIITQEILQAEANVSRKDVKIIFSIIQKYNLKEIFINRRVNFSFKNF